MKHYDQNYNIFERFNFVSLLVLIASFAIVILPINNFIRAVIFSFFFIGGISDLLVNRVIGYIWSHKSLKEVSVVKKALIADLKKVSWLPRIVGIFERIIFTTSFIIGKYEFIAIWLGLKVIGSWKNDSYENNKQSSMKLWRIRENIFLIGTALSIILSFIAAMVFLLIIDQQNSFLYKKPFRVQQRIMHLEYRYQNWPVRDGFLQKTNYK
jgi:hypothetical protein